MSDAEGKMSDSFGCGGNFKGHKVPNILVDELLAEADKLWRPLLKPLCWLEGIISSGKTTACVEICSRLNFLAIQEPADTDGFMKALLEKFYTDQPKWAFPIQIFFLMRRYAMHQIGAWNTTPGTPYAGAMIDRCYAGDATFASMHVVKGNIDPDMFRIYRESVTIMSRSLLPPTTLFFLDVEPEVAYERMQRRRRACEAVVPLDYLKRLRDAYEVLLVQAETGEILPWSHAIKVIRLDWNKDIVGREAWDEVARRFATILDVPYVGRTDL
jgi:deoxyadenosine/deoxycytidine kinase